MVKPRIVLSGKNWMCGHGSVVGFGNSPTMAYFRWLAEWMDRFNFESKA